VKERERAKNLFRGHSATVGALVLWECAENDQKQWRATVDEGGHYSFAVAL
jgi:hypothetical protein